MDLSALDDQKKSVCELQGTLAQAVIANVGPDGSNSDDYGEWTRYSDIGRLVGVDEYLNTLIWDPTNDREMLIRLRFRQAACRARHSRRDPYCAHESD